MTEAIEAAWSGDTEFEETTIKSVSGDTEHGWSIERADGWSFFVPADSLVEPKPGMPVRFYGRGIGFLVRGLFVDGQCVFYRTEEEQKEKAAIDAYGRDAADLLSRWDAGQCVWSIECGGFGPGYEQALQIAAMEVLRHLVGGGSIDDADGVLSGLDYLGLSGAQWGSAKMLANAFHLKGPRAVHEDYPRDRHIQVSKFFPVPPDRIRDAAPDMLEALKMVMSEKAPRYHDCTDDGLPKCAWCVVEEAITKAQGMAS